MIMDTGFVREINRRTVYQAGRYVFASWKSQTIAGIVNEAAVTGNVPIVNTKVVKDRISSRLQKRSSDSKEFESR